MLIHLNTHILTYHTHIQHVIKFPVITHKNISHKLAIPGHKSDHTWPRKNLDLVSKFCKYYTKFSPQFPAQAIRSLEHFRYNPVSKTEVPETRTDLFSTVRDPSHCSAHGLAENFILLNFRLHELSVESKNTRIRVRTGKLWPSEVGAADSQG